MSKAQSHGVDDEIVKTIANQAFDSFTKLAEDDLANVTEKVPR